MTREEVQKQSTRNNTRSLAFIGLSIALIVVSAWVTIPFGPIPFTLQVFAIAFALLALQPKEAIATLGGYLLLGAIGLPVFSGMRGGIGVLAGPTGGYLWGWLIGVCAACLLLHLIRPRLTKAQQKGALGFAVSFGAALVYLVITYACGWAQFIVVAQVSGAAAFMTTIAPFMVLDLIKLVAAVACAQAVRAVIASRAN